MPDVPAHPLQSLLAQAAKTLPAQTGAAQRYRDRVGAAGGPSTIVADVSGSMSAPAWGGHSKIAVLREAVEAERAGAGRHRRLVAFASSAAEVDVLPASAGGPPFGNSTDLAAALDLVAAWRPRHTLVISDGQPNDEAAALAAAERVAGVIDVLYVGPDGDAAAMDFLRRLARTGAGRCERADMRQGPRAVAAGIRALLPPPGREAHR